MIFYIMGKSASGKDSLYKKLLLSDLNLNRFVIYTTRPKRDGEQEGMEYYFVDEKYLDEHKEKIIEKRVYHTVFGDWYYATLDDGKIDDNKNYVVIGTLESYNSIKKYYGNDKVFPIDIGPRSGGNMIPDLLGMIFDCDVVEMRIRAAMGEKVQ